MGPSPMHTPAARAGRSDAGGATDGSTDLRQAGICLLHVSDQSLYVQYPPPTAQS